jgi:cell wall assembly regulator SMI1
MVRRLIERVDRWLAARRPSYYARLRPGVPDARLDEFESRFGLAPPESFRLLYGWRDGQEAACSDSLQGNFMFMPLAEISDTKGLLDGMIGADFEDPRWWRRGWVPFLDNGGGDHLCLDLVAEGGGRSGQLLTFWHDAAERPVRFPSPEAWLEDLVGPMEGGRLGRA